MAEQGTIITGNNPSPEQVTPAATNPVTVELSETEVIILDGYCAKWGVTREAALKRMIIQFRG